MSTDDSISEDVSSSGPLSHCPVSADGGKESEASLVSSEGTSAPGLSVSEDRHSTSHTTGGTVQSKPMDTPAVKNIRDLCLSPEVFGHGKNLPFINPSSIETLRALVQEIRNSGETNPEIWKDCEGRWLHLFQLVEKQYQEQILAQQEQYQCQIQLIQDEIKALVQIQNRQGSFQPHKDFSTVSKANTGGHALPPINTPCSNDNANQAVHEVTEVPAATELSSGYGTMFAWETSIVNSESALEDEDIEGQKKLAMSLNTEDKTSCVIECQQKHSSTKKPGVDRVCKQINQQLISGTNQQLTSWAQMNKLRPKKPKKGQLPVMITENKELRNNNVDSHQLIQFSSTDSLDQNQPGRLSSGLRRSDSLISEASGLTYWRLHENDLYHPLPDSFDSGVHLLKDTSVGFMPFQPSHLSLKEIYCNQQTDFKRVDRDRSCKSTSLSPQPQVLTFDPAITTRHSDRTSGFTSPTHFSSPSFSTPSQLGPRAETPLTPDSHNPGDVDYISDASSVCAARHSTLKLQDQWSLFSAPSLHHTFQHQAPVQSEPTQQEASCSVEDPAVLSLLRQNLREKHSRHVADLKAYYESEIQNLLDKLRLKDLPKDIEKNNQALSERCQHLEKALADATSRIQELEANNSSLEKKITEWSECYAGAGATVKSLQKRLEEDKRTAKEKDTLIARQRSRIQQLEEAAQKADREADEKKIQREREYKMLQDLLGEYDTLVKKHEGLKSNLVSTENKLVDAYGEIAELKKIISKMETQVKQLDHESQARVRHLHNNTQPSGAGLFHHPDLLLSPTKRNAQPDVIHTFSHSPIEQMNDGTKSHVTRQSAKSPYNKSDHLSSGNECPADIAAGGSWNPDCEPQSRPQDVSRKPGSSFITPMMRALIELEETRATQSRAPWLDNSMSTVGLVERRLKAPVQEQDIQPLSRVEKGRVRALQRSLSPESHRSSSLPPPAQRNVPPPNTPSKRETLLMPLSAKSSPKRCPSENFSIAFGHLMPREEHLQHSSPRKRLHFTSADTDCGQHPSNFPGDVLPPGINPQLDWDKRRSRDEDTVSRFLDQQLSLSETERLFDDLTQEKLQIEAALSRMPGAGRHSPQSRLDEVALENRLERLNRELGSLRMTLKRFHVLRSSANL